MFINVLVEKVAWKLVQKSRRGSTPASTYRFTEIGQTSYNKYIFDEKRTFQAEIWKKRFKHDFLFQVSGIIRAIRFSAGNSLVAVYSTLHSQ